MQNMVVIFMQNIVFSEKNAQKTAQHQKAQAKELAGRLFASASGFNGPVDYFLPVA